MISRKLAVKKIQMKINENNSFWLSFSALILGLFFVFLLIFASVFGKFAFLSDGAKFQAQILEQHEESTLNLAAKEEQIEELQAELASLKAQLSDTNASEQKEPKLHPMVLKAVANFKIRLRDKAQVDLNTGEILLDYKEFIDANELKEKEKLKEILTYFFDFMLNTENIKRLENIKITLVSTDSSSFKVASIFYEFIGSFYKNPALSEYLEIVPKVGQNEQILLGFTPKSL